MAAKKGAKASNGKGVKWVPKLRGGASWDREETIRGAFQSRRVVHTRRGKDVGVLTLLLDDGELVDVWQGAYLSDLHQDLNVGDIVQITPAGKEPGGNMRLYDVEIERGA